MTNSPAIIAACGCCADCVGADRQLSAWERTVIFLCLLDLAWFAIAFRVHPSAGDVLRHTMLPSMPGSGLTAGWLFLVIAIVGTTIAPWQLFFQQSYVADKRLRFSDLTWARLDMLIGAVFTILVAGCMMLAGNAAFQRHWEFTDLLRAVGGGCGDDCAHPASPASAHHSERSGIGGSYAALGDRISCSYLPEAKVDTEHLGPMQMTTRVRVCVFALGGYLLAMFGLVEA